MLEHRLGSVTLAATPRVLVDKIYCTPALCVRQGSRHPYNNRQERFLSMSPGFQRLGILSRWDWRDGRPRDGASVSA